MSIWRSIEIRFFALSSFLVDLACGERGPGFDSRTRRYDFRDWYNDQKGGRNDPDRNYLR